jgi:hypothetical protein
VDSQIVRSADAVGTALRGYHDGTKITGRSRHLAVDCEGWLLALADHGTSSRTAGQESGSS